MPVGENAESRARKAIDAQDPKQGQEMQQVQALQSSIQEIQGERNNNLMAARMGAEGDARENQAMLQAAEMGMLGGAAGVVAVENATPVQQTSPQTQAILSKYGVGKPKNQRVTTRSVQQTPTKITINNNTTNNTTNNVAVPAANVGGPVQGRTLAIKQQPDQGQARFKTWISNAFARQNQAAAQREKEYQRREWSLSRTTGKLMKKLQELGTTISERMDPRKIASSATNHFKTLLFLFGTMFLAKNWERVIRIGSNIERFFFGEVDPKNPEGKRGEPGWKILIKNLFGAKENETVGDAIKHFFSNKEKNGVFDMLMDKIKNFFKERGDAVKAIEIPKLNLSNLPDTVTKLIEYLGNIIKAAFGGADAIKDIISSNIKLVGKNNSIASEAIENRTFKTAKGVNIENTSWGDATTVFKPGSNEHLNSWDISSDNKITSTAGEIRQAGTITRMLSDKTSNTVNVAGVMSGMERLKNTADTKGGVLISKDFISGLRNLIDTKGLFDNNDLKVKRFKFIKREKTDNDYYKEGANWERRAVEGFAKRSVVEAGKKTIGADGIVSDIADAIVTGDIIQDPAWKAIVEGTKGLIKKGFADKYTLDMVPLDNPQKGEVLEVEEYDGPEWNVDPNTGARKTKKVNKSVFEFYEATPSFFEKIRTRLSEKLNNENFSFSTADETSLKQMEELMTQVKKKQLEDNKKYFEANHISFDNVYKNIHSDIDIDKQFENYHNIVKESEKRDKELDKKYESSPLKRSGDYIKNEIIDPVKDWITGSSEDHKNHAAIAITKEEQIKNAKSAMDFFISKGLTTEQAAGIVGVLHAESGLNPGIVNEQEKKDGKGGYGRGIAQWSNERIKEFGNWYKSKYGEYKEPQETDFATQLEYVWKEMQDRPAFMKAIKSTNDIVEATDYMLRGFENGSTNRLASPENIDSTYLKKAGRKQAYDSMMAERVPRAKGIYELYTGKSSENSGDEKQKIPEDQQDTSTQPDASGVYLSQNTSEAPKVTEYGVEYNGQTYNPEFAQNLGYFDTSTGRWNWGGSSNALAMADNASKSPVVTPESSRQVSGGISSGSTNSGSPTLKTADQMSSSSTNNTDNLLTGINTQLTNLNTLTAAASDQQVQATMTIAQAIGNMQITINNEKSPQTSVSSWGGIPGSNET